MLSLMLLRHAKAAPQARGDDFGRVLQEVGRRNASQLGVYLAGRNLVPDMALVSSAARTRETFDILMAALRVPVPATFEDALYNATAGELRARLPATEPGIRTLLIIGHNPGIADLAVMLARQGDHADIARLRSRFPPCNLAVVGFDDEEWADAASRGGRLDLLVAPHDLDG